MRIILGTLFRLLVSKHLLSASCVLATGWEYSNK